MIIKKFAKAYVLFVLLFQSFFISASPPGTFQEITGSPFAAGANPAWAAYSPIVSGNLFLAIPNYGDNTVSAYVVDQTTGALTPVTGSPFSTGGQPAAVAYSPLASGNLFAAVINFNDNTVSVYSVNQTSGVFTQVTGSPFATGVGPYSVAYSPIVSGNLFAAITNSDDNTVSVYSVNQTSGVFTQVTGSPFATGSGPYTVAFSPVVSANLFAAVTNFNDGTASVYEVNQTSGAFTQITGSPFATGSGPYGIAYSPVVSGNLFASAVNLNDNTISSYSVNQTTGAFTPVTGSPFATDGTGVNEIAYSPLASGDLFAAAVNFASNNVSVYVVDQTTGALTQVTGSPFATGAAPDGIAFTPVLSGKLFAATGNYSDNNVSVFQVSLPASIDPPTELKACKKTSPDTVKNILRWSPPASGSAPVSYNIYLDAGLTDLVGTVSADHKLRFVNVQPNIHSDYTYYIVSVDESGDFSAAASITVTKNCCKKKKCKD